MLEPSSTERSPERAMRPLSARETEVVEMTALGLTNTEIARRLGVTTHAVKFHLSSIYEKLEVTNRTEAAVAYVRSRPPEAG